MPAEWEAWIGQFLAVLTRVAAAISFVPLPGLRQAPPVPKIVLTLGLALLLSHAIGPRASLHKAAPVAWADVVWSLPAEALLGLGAGVTVGWILEVFTIGMQILSLQAGFSYASMIDPATQADSGVLQVAGQLAAGLLFVSLGWEREVLGAFAASLDRAPPGVWQMQPELANMAAQWTGAMIALAFRLAFPVAAFLLLLDLTLALLGRTQPQLPLVNLALPVKMGASFLLLAWHSAAFPAMLGRAMEGAIEQLGRLGVAR